LNFDLIVILKITLTFEGEKKTTTNGFKNLYQQLQSVQPAILGS
jgi:hypothetical protein